MIELNTVAPMSLTKCVLPHMIARQRGHIVINSSIAGKIGNCQLLSLLLQMFCALYCSVCWSQSCRFRYHVVSWDCCISLKWPQRTAHIHRSAGERRLLSGRIWSSHLLFGRPGGRFQVLNGLICRSVIPKSGYMTKEAVTSSDDFICEWWYLVISVLRIQSCHLIPRMPWTDQGSVWFVNSVWLEEPCIRWGFRLPYRMG